MKPKKRIQLIVFLLAYVLPLCPPATGVEISDLPMDSLVKAALPNLMFVLDNSGSMDWEYIIQGGDGSFSPDGTTYEYIYGNPGDNVYTSDPYDDAPTGDARLYWKGRTNAHNRIFYNSDIDYVPWPGADEDGNVMANASTTEPRSNPYKASPTFDITAEYFKFMHEVYVDNSDTTHISFSSPSEWTLSTPGGTQGADSYVTTTQSAWFKWTPEIPATGEYYVDIWNPRSNDSTTVARYTIVHADGTTTFNKNQRTSGNYGTWNTYGPFTFNQGLSGFVTVDKNSATANTWSVYADAIRFRQTTGDPALSIKNAHYFIWKDTDNDGLLTDENAYLVNFVNGVRAYYQLSAAVVSTGKITALADLTELTELPENVRPARYDDDGNVIAFLTDAEDLQNFANWYSYYRRRSLTAKAAVSRTIVSMEDIRVGMYSLNDNNSTAARFGVLQLWRYITTTPDAEVIEVDNADSGTTSYDPFPLAGNVNDGWRESSGSSEWKNSSYDTRKYNAWFRFTPNITKTQPYDVYVRYSSRNSRDPSAKYNVVHAGGTWSTDINQTQNRGEWVRLTGGPFTFNEGTDGYVEVVRDTNNTSTYTGADAVRFVSIPESTTEYGFDWSILDALYNMESGGGTPLRTAFKEVGEYFNAAENSALGESGIEPWEAEVDGGACQQSFCVVMTDGYYNDTFTLANQDGGMGTPFADTYANTLADVAMRYYKTDLVSTLPNEVPRYSCDQASHQHLVSYTVAFGLKGTLDPGDGKACTLVNSGATVTWPNPSDSEPKKIDDLYHAGVNGRGAYFSASDPNELVMALVEIMSNISARKASGASVSVNGEELNDGTMIYQATFKTFDWIGDVRAYPIDSYGTVSDTMTWSAAEKIGTLDYNSRCIVTYNPEDANGADGKGIPFRYDSLTTAQKALLGDDTAGPKVLEYLRGRTDNAAAENYRLRKSILGDIVHSSPYLSGNTVYAGGNDGMLHAFDANTGLERFAYVPNIVFSNLYHLTEPTYSHLFYVDSTPYAEHFVLDGSPRRTLLVGGLGKGGKGYYGLDITDADTWSSTTDESVIASAVVWEYDGVALADNDMGYSHSDAWIVKTYDYDSPDGYAWSVIFGNGYNSVNGHAVLYVLNAQDGTLRKKIDTGVGVDNGLSTPVVVDFDRDGIVDYVYAGDLKGNLWKFDLTVPAVDEPEYISGAYAHDYWGSAYGDDVSAMDSNNRGTVAINAANSSGDLPKPLFKAEGQPITSKPDVSTPCDLTKKGLFIIFGTGKYLGLGDRTTTDTQTIYGIWDYGDDKDDLEYVGSFNPVSNTWSDRPYSQTYTLLEQEEIFSIDDTTAATDETTGDTYGEFGVLTDEVTDYSTATDTSGYAGDPNPAVHAGWFFNLPIEKERVVKDAIIRGKIAIFLSFIPGESLCSGGGDSVLNEVSLCTGGRTEKPVIDINDDTVVDAKDQLKFNEGGVDIIAPAQRRAYGGMLHEPKIIEGMEELKYFSTSSGTIIRATEAKEGTGIYFWREL